MTERPFIYVPILKWRQGEYQALMRLSSTIKDAVLPLIVVPPVEYDFERQSPVKTVQAHIETFPKRYHAKWGDRPSLIDIHHSLEGQAMDDGTSVIKFIFDSIQKKDSTATPVVRASQSSAYIGVIKKIVSENNTGVAIRVPLEDLMRPDLNIMIERLISDLAINHTDVDIIFDLGAPHSFQPYSVFARAISNSVRKVAQITSFRTFVVAGTSLDLSKIKRPGGSQTRHEWLLHQELLRELASLRSPIFGDYSIESPNFISQDMRLINPAGKIVYTTGDSWIIPKGASFRENRSQMALHCGTIINSGHYCGQNYSSGDKRIYDTFHGIEGLGNQGTWKEVGVSHHLTFVADQISKLRAL